MVGKISAMAAVAMLMAAVIPQNAAFAADPVKLPALSQKAVEAANASPLIRFNKDSKGGAYTNGAWDGGGSIVLAVASYEGNAATDDKLLEQLRYSLKGDNCICANGGYPTQHERHVTGMYTILKNTPRLWDKLTADEKHKIDLLMQAALVGAAYTTSDANNARGHKVYALDGDDNLNRGWNPNYQEGMIGEMVVGSVYFGGAEAEKFLNSFNCDAFVKELKDAGLTNTYKTFTWKAEHADSNAPTGKEIEAAIKNYRYMNIALSDPFDIYYKLTMNTYGAKVNAGLNDGAGLKGSGMIATGADTLPNKGKEGMLLEFDSKDAGGPRSSITYAYDGFRPNLTNHIVLIIGGQWKNGAKGDECLARMNVGIPDLFYKLEHGYKDYSKGKGDTHAFDIHAKGWNFVPTRALWEEVIKPYHEGAAK